jgi:hypothetical protein
MATRKPPRRRARGKTPEQVIAEARSRLGSLPTPVLHQVHDLLERLLNADRLDKRLIARLQKLLDQSGG